MGLAQATLQVPQMPQDVQRQEIATPADGWASPTNFLSLLNHPKRG